MADGRIPLRELVTNQNRGQLEILLAAGTSIQLENLKSKVLIGTLNPPIILFSEVRHFSNSRTGWRKIEYAYRSIFTEFWRDSRRRTRTWRSSKTSRRSSRPITAWAATIRYKLFDFNWKMFQSEYSSEFKSSSQTRLVPRWYDPLQ